MFYLVGFIPWSGKSFLG